MTEQDIETLRRQLARVRRQAILAVDPKVAAAYAEMVKAYETRIDALDGCRRSSRG